MNTNNIQSISELSILIGGQFMEACMVRGVSAIMDYLPRGISREGFELAYGHEYTYRFLEENQSVAYFSEYILFCETKATINKEFGTLKFKN